MFHYFTYDPSVFREMIPNVMREIPEDDDENFLISLLNQLQVDWQNEVDYKTGKNSIPEHSDIINITCDAMYREMNDSRFTSIILSNPEMNYEQQLINFCHSIEASKYGNDKLLTEDILLRLTKLLLTKNNNVPDHVSVYEINEIYYLLTEILFVYRPLRTKFGNYYFEIVLEDKMKIHFLFLLFFLLGIIILQVIDFVIIKFVIFDKIETTNQNFDKLMKILKCI